MFETAVNMFCALLVLHALADFPWQGPFISEAKNPIRPVRNTPWELIMFWHAVIHGGFVWAGTGYLFLGVCEVIAHFVIDWAKCVNYFGGGRRAFYIDQGLHVACKVVWVGVALVMS